VLARVGDTFGKKGVARSRAYLSLASSFAGQPAAQRRHHKEQCGNEKERNNLQRNRVWLNLPRTEENENQHEPRHARAEQVSDITVISRSVTNHNDQFHGRLLFGLLDGARNRIVVSIREFHKSA
jgi:hypothetical protein